MLAYHDMLRHVLQHGKRKTDRTGVGTVSVFGHQAHFPIAPTFPLVTTKRVHWKSVVAELLWMLSGATNIRPLVEQKVSIWSDWPHAGYRRATGEEITLRAFEDRIREDADFAAKWGDLGPVYGAQWRRWLGQDGQPHDQLATVISQLRTRPDDRGIIMSGWNVPDLPAMSLRPCHTLYQWGVNDGVLDCHLYQRSGDLFLGVPFNIASASLLTSMLAQICGLQAGDLIHSFGDLHLYSNHLDQAEEQLSRDPRPGPRLVLDPSIREIDDFTRDHIQLEGYDPHPPIKAEVAV